MTANLDLCKRLYKLTGWDECPNWYVSRPGVKTEVWDLYDISGDAPDNYEVLAAAYDSDFLLDKLKDYGVNLFTTIDAVTNKLTGGWTAVHIRDAKPPLVMSEGASAADALCSLAIKLKEKGVI